MEETAKISTTIPNSKEQSVKTEINPRCVVFTYFQGDINSVVDEHFSRALNKDNIPKDMSTKSKNADAAIKNEKYMPPAMGNAPQTSWIGSYQAPQPPPPRIASTGHSLPVPSEYYQPTVLQGQPPQLPALWPFSPDPCSVYHHPLTDPPLVQGSIPDRHYTSLLSLLQHDRLSPESNSGTVTTKQDLSPSCTTGTQELYSVDQGLHLDREFQPQDKRKDIYWY
ncbi:transcription cofactor vestigial-like protein 1 [Protopterus annectens]|uniref:transcription cofactor vestigial-like protein 1 n=1 Tax=Protopterus annectens TaxID=7888 RepID=UPI001CFB64D5|nr:transcription cofactor vestigial-like protein 1 [Protopterus annectens]